MLAKRRRFFFPSRLALLELLALLALLARVVLMLVLVLVVVVAVGMVVPAWNDAAAEAGETSSLPIGCACAGGISRSIMLLLLLSCCSAASATAPASLPPPPSPASPPLAAFDDPWSVLMAISVGDTPTRSRSAWMPTCAKKNAFREGMC